MPIVLIALAIKYLCRAVLSFLVHVLDYAFPILLQLARFPLFTLRIIGDGIAALLKGVVRWLPLSGTKREAWRELVSRHWAWLRQKISYKAFEEAVHHAFERGMAWVFRTCRTLTPAAALLVLAGAVLWLPVSFVIATGMHAVLIAKAASLPAWMQLLHPLATVIAKSKLLVLPAYPAAWPQAKKHPLIQAAARLYRYVTSFHVIQKVGYRYTQFEHAVQMVHALRRAVARGGLGDESRALLADMRAAATSIGDGVGAATRRAVEISSKVPVLGAIVTRYAAHYTEVDERPGTRLSEKIKGFFGRWSIKFSAEYYEAKEKEEAAARG